MRRVACAAVRFTTMTVCRKLNSLQMAPPSHLELESQPTNVAVEQSEPGSRAETQRAGVSDKGEWGEIESLVCTLT